jgi:hypothetical protein
MDPGSATPALAGVLTAAQGGIGAGGLEGWHHVGSAGEPSFQNGWSNWGAGWPGAAFRKLPDGTVRIKGTVKNGSVGQFAVFTLPPGYRPGENFEAATVSNGAFGYLGVLSNGQVQVRLGSSQYAFLNVSFFAEG